MISAGDLDHCSGADWMDNRVHHAATFKITDVETEGGRGHVEVTINLLQILFVLMWRPTGPRSIATPSQSTNEPRCRCSCG